MPPEPQLVVARVPVSATYALRQRVLRPGLPLAATRFDVDDDPCTAAFAACESTGAEAGDIVGATIVFPAACPWLPDRAGAWRLRGMATEPARRSQGVGRLVLAAALDHVREAGGQLIWCNARVPARRFYERAGFAVHGEPWDEPDIGPHVAMWRDLAS